MNIMGKYTEEEVINSPLPRSTDSYTTVPNGVVINTLQEEMDRNNITVLKKNYLTARDRRQTVSQWLLTNGVGNEEYTPQVVWRNSYDKSMKFHITSGVGVLVCSNGMMINLPGSGSDYSRKHTGNALEEIIGKCRYAISRIDDTFRQLEYKIERMKEVTLDKRSSAELLGRMLFEEEIIGTTQYHEIKKEYNGSEHFKAGNDGYTSLYNFYNNTTHALKASHPLTYMRDHIKFDQFITNQFFQTV